MSGLACWLQSLVSDLRQCLCRSLSHLYHYYLHGEQGNCNAPGQGHRADAPQVIFECICSRNTIWTCDLADVNDDLESLYLQVIMTSDASL